MFVAAGQQIGVDEFLLVQWIAPLASESPELIVACLYAVRLKASHSLGTLLSSKVDQWTLLVGTIPVVFAISATTTHGLPIDTNQRLELLITAAQSLFAVSILVNLGLTTAGVGALFALAAGQLLRRRRDCAQVLRDGLVRPFSNTETPEEVPR